MTSSSRVCGPCKDYNNVAVVYCSICEKILCEECKEEHGSVKILKTHMLRDTKELPAYRPLK
ncbi:hypothetical protein DPMN_122932 [Dreissena polymorpha]|uniref:B box-type domain-containing protein n=1 Tax=Dreissena polymorpha TaxID=45954 RepID=A0A9D4GQM9_DREPO|nr:hypothetical protein DPMN_122932 [Dreissena polymorpha]